MQFYVTGKKIVWLCPFIAIFLNCLFNLKLFSLKIRGVAIQEIPVYSHTACSVALVVSE